MKVGQSAKIVPPVEDSEWLSAKLDKITTAPVATGKYNASFDLAGDEIPAWIVPGMSCKVKVTTLDKKDAVVIPKKAVQTDKYDEEQKYVWLVNPKDADVKPKRRDVELGKTSGEDVEVLKGLKAGQVVSLEDEEKKDQKTKDE